jgi:hypothetical protein
MDLDIQKYLVQAQDWLITSAPKFLAGLAVLVIGWWLAGRIVKVMHAALSRANVSKDLIPFLLSLPE